MKIVSKRRICRPWGRKQRGGWIVQPAELLKGLKEGEAAEFGKITVGAKQLRLLLTYLEFPDQELLVSSNGQLEVSNVERFIVRKQDGTHRVSFRKPRCQHSFRVCNNAWLKDKKVTTTIVFKPKKY